MGRTGQRSPFLALSRGSLIARRITAHHCTRPAPTWPYRYWAPSSSGTGYCIRHCIAQVNSLELSVQHLTSFSLLSSLVLSLSLSLYIYIYTYTYYIYAYVYVYTESRPRLSGPLASHNSNKKQYPRLLAQSSPGFFQGGICSGASCPSSSSSSSYFVSFE